MSTWGEVTGLEPTMPSDPEPTGPPTEPPASAARLEALRLLKVETYRGDGPEPPPHVLRLRYVESEDFHDVVRSKSGGWRWCVRADPTRADSLSGWDWKQVANVGAVGLWRVTEQVEGADVREMHLRSEEPPAGVDRVQPLGEDYQPVTAKGSMELTQIVRVAGGGWWWVRDGQPPPDRRYGWAWRGSNTEQVSYWTDITDASKPVLPVDGTGPGEYHRDGPQPPRHIVRLKLDDRDDEHVTRHPGGGWWLVKAHQTPDDAKGTTVSRGWSWGNAPRGVLRPVYPVIDPHASADDDMVAHLAKSLPDDEEWYRIATMADGRPIFAYNVDGEEFDYHVGDPR